MPALLSEVFKETSFTIDDGQIKAHYGKPAEPKVQPVNNVQKEETPEKKQWEERIIMLVKQNNQLQEQIKAMQQKVEKIVQQGGTRFDIIAFAEQNPVIAIIIILVGIDLFAKAFLK
jgi:primosomal protein N''